MKQHITSLKNYERGFEHWKRTKLQKSLFDYHSSARESLGENSEYHRAMCNIAGNKGLSHEKRIERISDWFNNIGGSFNYFEKSQFNGLLDQCETYVSKNIGRIKNSGEVLKNIGTLRDKLDYSPVRDFNQQPEIRESGAIYIKEAAPSPEVVQIADYQPAPQTNRGFLKRTGDALLKTVAYLGVGAVLFAAGKGIYEWGQTTQQPTITQQQSTIREREGQITSLSTVLEQEKEYGLKLNEMFIGSKENCASLEEQRKDLEQKLIIAGRPDGIIREEARKGMVEKEKLDSIKRQFEEVSKSYKGLKGDYKTLEKENEQLAETNDNLEQKLDGIENPKPQITKDPKLTGFQNSVWTSKVILDPNYTQPSAKTNNPNATNTEWENRLAVVGEAWLEPELISKEHCDCSTMGFKEREYLDYNFMDYPNKIGKNAKKHWEDKEIVPALCSSAGAIVATANDGLEYIIVKPAAGILRGALGVVSRGLGNKKEGFKHGVEEGRKFGASLMDDLPGGQTKNTFDTYLIKGKFKKAFDVPYCMENTKTKGHIKLGGTIISNILTFFGNKIFGHHSGHHDVGGFERVGGEVGAGAGRSGGVVK